jgi:hypothetical protein
MPDTNLQKILSIPTRFHTSFPYPQETSRAIEMRGFADTHTKTTKVWQNYIQGLECFSIDSFISKHGTCRRPHGIVDLYALSSITVALQGYSEQERLQEHVEQAYRVAKQALEDNSARIAGVMGNASYLAQYLVPAGLIALGVDKNKADTIFEAVMKTGSRAGKYAMYAGLASLWLNFKPHSMPLKRLKQNKQTIQGKRMDNLSYGNASRIAFLKIAWQAWRSGKTYGLGNFQYCITDYYEYIQKGNQQVHNERWSDKAHNEYAEIMATCGTRGLWASVKFYAGHYFHIKESYVRGAWLAHVVFLAFLFRTASSNLQEAFMSSFAVHEVLDNDYVQKSDWKAQVKRWHGAWQLEKAMATKDKKLFKTIDEVEIEGKSMVWIDIAKVNHYKKLMEANIARSPLNAERVYRYAYVLNAIKDKNADKWIERFKKIAPKRDDNFTE